MYKIVHSFSTDVTLSVEYYSSALTTSSMTTWIENFLCDPNRQSLRKKSLNLNKSHLYVKIMKIGHQQCNELIIEVDCKYFPRVLAKKCNITIL